MKLAVAAIGLAACQPAAGPMLDALEPAQGVRGVMVTVRGVGFCGAGAAADDGSCTSLPPGAVDFGLDLPMARARVVSWSAAAIDVTVPAAAPTGMTDVIVTVDGRSSNALAFEVLP